MRLPPYRRVWASLLLSAVLFFIMAGALIALPRLGLPEQLAALLNIAKALLLAVIAGALVELARRHEGAATAVAGAALALAFVMLATVDQYAATFVLTVGMGSAAFYEFARRGIGFRGALRRLGIARARLLRETSYGIFITVAIYLMLLLLAVAYAGLGIQDAENVERAIQAAPLHLLVLAVLVNPATEELFFRGLLAPRLGVLGSSLLFAFFHVLYGSVVEVINVFIIGAIYAQVYLSRRSLIAPLVSHTIINASAVYLMRFLG